MHIKVDQENQNQLDTFNHIWIECWNEKGYELEFNQNSDKFIILDENGKVIGTTEFIKYEIGKNFCEDIYPFKDLQQIKNNHNRVIEIDKIALTKKFRGKNVQEILYTIYKYAQENNIQFAIGLMEPIFYKAMKLFYKMPITKLSRKKFYKGDWVIPVIIDCEYVLNNSQEYKWVSKLDDTSVDTDSIYIYSTQQE